MKFGDVVIYEESGKQYNATVLQARDLADHLGTKDEPLVILCFAREVLDINGKPSPLAGTGSWSKLIQIRHDVAHKSHEYSEAAKKRYGQRYEGGRWSEIPPSIIFKESPNQISQPQSADKSWNVTTKKTQ
jgi:hypothetical protein